MIPAIFGVAGQRLSADERHFFEDCQPLGFILFARNVADRYQLRGLTDELRQITRADVPILIDQEGGRVARMGPPEWRAYPPPAQLAECWAADPALARRLVYLNYEALGLDLAEVGINVDCAPVLDVPRPGAHDVIGDRALGLDPAQVADLGGAALEGLATAGVVAVIKHIPGHGRATQDSHHDLPEVDAGVAQLTEDLEPFRALAHAPMAMTAHIRYPAWDPKHCATLSPTIIGEVIRGEIGFAGLLMTDDLDMKALSGDIASLAAAALEAGCDVALNCWAKMEDMRAIAERLPDAGEACRARLARAMGDLRSPPDLPTLAVHQQALLEERDRLLATLA